MSVGPLKFERFTDVHRRLSASLTIRQNGQLMLNEDARSEYGLHQYQYVILFFDRVQRAIGIRFTNDKTEDGALHLLSGSHNSYVNARSFFEKFQIDYSEARKFDLEPMGELLVTFLRDQDIFDTKKPSRTNLSDYDMPVMKYGEADPEVD